jgi:alpha-L-fucosidase
VGNEEGYARETEWSVVPATARDQKKIAENFGNLNWMDVDIGSRDKILKADRLIWYPAECDTGIRPGWFFNKNYKTKSLQSLLSIYLKSVGRNAVLLLNVPPDKRGLIHEDDVERLGELRKSLDSIFKIDLALNASIHTCSVRDHNDRFSADKALDGKDDTFWSPNEINGGCFEFDLGKIQKINCVLIQENIRNGQRVESFTVETNEKDGWRKITDGTTIGYKRILCFNEIEVRKIRVRINQSRSYPEIGNFAIYYAPQLAIDKM